jgi:hypothetical protein
MRTLAALVLSFVLPIAALGQQPGGSRNGPPDPLDKAQTGRYYLRMADEARARKAIDEAAIALHTKAYKDFIANYDQSHLPRLLVTWGDFISSQGTVFLAVQLAPSTTPVKPDTKIDVFGMIAGPDGKPLLDFEEPVRVQKSGNDLFVTRTFFLTARKATATFGLGIKGEAVEGIRIELDRDELTPASAGISRLLVSNNVFNLDHVQNPFEPFAFGGTQVVPKPDRTFRPGDEVWLFAEVRNPHVDGQGLPKLSTQIVIQGNGRKIVNSPVLDPQPLKGVRGHYGVGTALDLSMLAAGDYHVTLTVRDALSSESFQREETITLRQ